MELPVNFQGIVDSVAASDGGCWSMTDSETFVSIVIEKHASWFHAMEAVIEAEARYRERSADSY